MEFAAVAERAERLAAEPSDIGTTTCREAIVRAAGPNVTAADVEDRLAERGEIGGVAAGFDLGGVAAGFDLGGVAAGFDLGGQRGLSAFAGGRDPLTVAAVERTLRESAAAEGAGSESRKVETLFGPFNRCPSVEAKLLARLVLGEMRLGVGEGTGIESTHHSLRSRPRRSHGAGSEPADPGRYTKAASRWTPYPGACPIPSATRPDSG